MPRKAKITTDKSARAYQRARTNELKKYNSAQDPISSSPPDYLSGVAAKAYTTIVDSFAGTGILAKADTDIVVLLAQQIQVNRDAYTDIFGGDGKDAEGTKKAYYKAIQSVQTGEVLEHQFAGWKINPSVSALKNSATMIKSLCSELGMTPTARASLLQLTKPDDDDNSGDWTDQNSNVNSNYSNF